MKNQTLTGISHSSLGDVLKDAVAKLQPSYTKRLRPTLLLSLTARVKGAVAVLASQNCTPTDFYCSSLSTSFTQALANALKDSGSIDDFWGNPYTFQDGGGQLILTTRGPDEKAGTADDSTLSFAYTDLGLPQVTSPTFNEGAGPVAGATGAAGAASVVTAPGGPYDGSGGAAASAPRVRTDFPETLYVNPSVITDSTGQATIDVNMADSITQWRVSALASSADGRIVGTDAGIEVFSGLLRRREFPRDTHARRRGRVPNRGLQLLGYTANSHARAGPWHLVYAVGLCLDERCSSARTSDWRELPGAGRRGRAPNRR